MIVQDVVILWWLTSQAFYHFFLFQSSYWFLVVFLPCIQYLKNHPLESKTNIFQTKFIAIHLCNWNIRVIVIMHFSSENLIFHVRWNIFLQFCSFLFCHNSEVFLLFFFWSFQFKMLSGFTSFFSFLSNFSLQNFNFFFTFLNPWHTLF